MDELLKHINTTFNLAKEHANKCNIPSVLQDVMILGKLEEKISSNVSQDLKDAMYDLLLGAPKDLNNILKSKCSCIPKD